VGLQQFFGWNLKGGFFWVEVLVGIMFQFLLKIAVEFCRIWARIVLSAFWFGFRGPRSSSSTLLGSALIGVFLHLT